MSNRRKERGEQTLSVAAALTGAAIGGPPGALAGKAMDIVGGEVLDRALAARNAAELRGCTTGKGTTRGAPGAR